jgi:PIN domain nuclease of toxin-antitoxin system
VTEATTAVVADTHIVIWVVLNPAKLSSEATEALEACVAASEPIRVSAHSCTINGTMGYTIWGA